MSGLSTLATIISAISFPFIFIVLLYPHVAGARGKWTTMGFVAGVSIGTMLIAVLSSPEPHFVDQAWGWLDWAVMIMGTGILLVVIIGRYANLKQIARAQNIIKRERSKSIQSPRVSEKGKRSS